MVGGVHLANVVRNTARTISAAGANMTFEPCENVTCVFRDECNKKDYSCPYYQYATQEKSGGTGVQHLNKAIALLRRYVNLSKDEQLPSKSLVENTKRFIARHASV